jgi:hypothetical protein
VTGTAVGAATSPAGHLLSGVTSQASSALGTGAVDSPRTSLTDPGFPAVPGPPAASAVVAVPGHPGDGLAAAAGTGHSAGALGALSTDPARSPDLPVPASPASPVTPGGGSSGESFIPGSGSGAGWHGHSPALLIAAVLLTAGAALRRLAAGVPCTSAVLFPHEVPG